MKTYQIRNMLFNEVERELRNAEEDLTNLRFQKGIKQLSNPLQIRIARRNVARLRTILREHELEIRRLTTTPAEITETSSSQTGE